MNWYLKVLRQYADFNGRSRRTEFWMFVIINIIIAAIAAFVDRLFGITFNCGGDFAYAPQDMFGPIHGLYMLIMLIPTLAVTVRRLHDTSRSGWMILVALIPVVGGIWLLILMLIEGTPGENKYGFNPKELV
ncbi:MAG: DUF805 domain-containing protein [Bacteroidales bacterium]|jgi:uncharacterized membrane protein YhaH (DUF805 family)|nr:DUF805 domain-containing protein [Bacteroidales bacterium]MDD3273981.1 DUF805 domain-containing protein [Bacteroidales bacterium]MDD4058596.1 DUF805 domain-containing protein [Bacteroidales bacterium]